MYSCVNAWLHVAVYLMSWQLHIQVVFFVSNCLCTHEEPQLVQVCLHKMYRQYFEQVVLQGLAELIAREIMCIACWGITTHDFPSSLN